MVKNNVPLKVAIGYGIVAIVLALAIYLIYSNTQSILNINRASQEYARQREKSDSLMAVLLAEEQANLQKLSMAMNTDGHESFLQQKADNLNKGKDSIIIEKKAPQTHQAKQTTVEVVKTRKGFLRRLADAFRKEHTDTIQVTQATQETTTDSVTMPIDVGDQVADALDEISKEERKASKGRKQDVSKKMSELQTTTALLALRSNQQMERLHQQEKASLQLTLNKAMEARRQLIWQVSLLAIVVVLTAIILLVRIWRDTQKAHEYQENLRRAKDETQRIMEQRERLLLTITHDIKAPAASISGFTDLLLDEASQPKERSYVKSIRHSATHLSHLVATLLDYHQLENGLMTVSPINFSPAALVEECVDAMRLKAEAKQLTLDCDTDSHGNSTHGKEFDTHAIYHADAFRIRQIIDNIVGNAIKYTDRGGVKVGCYINKVIDKLQLVLTIKDTGKGMTTEECQRVFQAFTRLKEAQGIEGVGLGLSITHELTTLLGGEIRVSSEKGKGSTFTVVLPIEKATEEKEEKSLHSIVFANHKVLILDDDTLQLRLLEEMLKQAAPGWQAFTCNHVSEALTVIHNEQPALMLMDVEMPEMNGIDFLRHIEHSNMMVIAMTAHDESILPQLKEAGFDDCLFKPFKMEKLKDVFDSESTDKAECQEDILQKESKQQAEDKNPFAPLLAFAEGDPDAEQEILSNLKKELQAHLARLESITKEGKYSERSSEITQVAHKLLPVATMLHFASIPELQALSPEHIEEQEEGHISLSLQAIMKDLSDTLSQQTMREQAR